MRLDVGAAFSQMTDGEDARRGRQVLRCVILPPAREKLSVVAIVDKVAPKGYARLRADKDMGGRGEGEG